MSLKDQHSPPVSSEGGTLILIGDMMYIFPCNADKSPATPNGLYDARPEAEWTQNSAYWGAPCGELNGFIVIDVDKKSGGLETAASFDWGDTFVAETQNGGKHIYYQYDASHGIRNRVGLMQGIDVRAQGGYVILYEEVDQARIKPIPAWLLPILQKEPAKVSLEIDDEVGEGGRNNYLTRHAGRMQKIGVLTLAALKEINETKCSPPLDDSEVELIYASVKRYNPESTPEEDELPPKKIIWAGELISGFLDYLRDKGRVQGDPTGIAELDDLLGGGKRLGELTVTLAEAKSGKNTLWHYLQRIQLDKGIPIGYASRELSPETEVLPNLLTLALDKNLYKSEDVSEEQLVTAMRDWKLAFAPGYGAFQGEELFDWMDECRHFGISYFYIDHLHYCIVNSEDYAVAAELARRLKTYAKTHMVHIDLIIQPKNIAKVKQGDKLVKPELDIDLLRGGANLGQVLDSLLTMQRMEDSNGDLMDVVKVSLKRARSKLAKPGHFYLKYNRELMTFKVSDATGVEIGDLGKPRMSIGQNPNRSVFNVEQAASNMVKRIRQKEALTNNQS